MTDDGRARVSKAIANIIGNKDIKLLYYSNRLVDLVDERSQSFETSIASLKTIAETTKDEQLLSNLAMAQKSYIEAKKHEQEAKEEAEKERQARLGAEQVAQEAKEAEKKGRMRAKKESGNTTDSSDGVVREPNAETLAAIAETEAGNGIRTYSIEELKADLLGKTNN